MKKFMRFNDILLNYSSMLSAGPCAKLQGFLILAWQLQVASINIDKQNKSSIGGQV